MGVGVEAARRPPEATADAGASEPGPDGPGRSEALGPPGWEPSAPPAWKANLAQCAPLVFMGVAFGAFAVYLHSTGVTAVRSPLPLWFLFAGFGGIAGAGAAAMILIGDPGSEGAAPDPAAETPEPSVTVPRSEWEDVQARLRLLSRPPVYEIAHGPARGGIWGDAPSRVLGAAATDSGPHLLERDVSVEPLGLLAEGGQSPPPIASESEGRSPSRLEIEHRMDEFLREIETVIGDKPETPQGNSLGPTRRRRPAPTDSGGEAAMSERSSA